MRILQKCKKQLELSANIFEMIEEWDIMIYNNPIDKNCVCLKWA